jgi:predicted ATPase/DNA-binding winged helix-turn-helix (wHTH) protein
MMSEWQDFRFPALSLEREQPLATASRERGLVISFGPFRLLAAQRLLLEGDKPVRLGSRAFDILAALVERGGEVVGKRELIARAWPETFVEDANLKIQVGALRRALGDGQGGHRYVVTVPGRGYNFVAPVRLEEQARASFPPTIAPAGMHNLPLAVTRMIGRDEAVAALVSRVSRHRLVTIVGPGGIGKTTVALAVAECMIGSYEHGVWLVDLARRDDPRLVPSAVATVLGLEIHTEDPLSGLVDGLRNQRILLLLDNCEHVIDAAASLAAAVLGGAPGVSILATSRESLGVAGERGYRLGPLSSPEPSYKLTAAEAAVFPAVHLFVERVTAIVEDFTLTDANAPLVVEICRRLDGLPLAIEFAAPRVEVLGVEGLVARLDDSLPSAQRRAVVPRHRTMRAVVDWSYALLSEDEQPFFRALGIFTGTFTVEAAAAVAMDAANTAVDAIDRLADLVAKSLIVADISGVKPRFRLLDTTRAYAIEKLDESGERDRIARRHAGYYSNLFERAEDEAAVRPAGEWLGDNAREIGDLRGARLGLVASRRQPRAALAAVQSTIHPAER